LAIGLRWRNKGGPWLFRQVVVSIDPYDRLALPETVDLNYFTTSIQIHKVHVGYQKKSLIANLTEKKVGKVVEVRACVRGPRFSSCFLASLGSNLGLMPELLSHWIAPRVAAELRHMGSPCIYTLHIPRGGKL
jgi:hypothetical protein